MKETDRPSLMFVAPQARFFRSHRLPLALAARERGFRVTLACPTDEDARYLASLGIEHRDLPVARASRNPLNDLRMLAGLNRLFRECRPDVVHLITAKATLYGGTLARLRGIPAVAAITGLGFLFTSDMLSNRLLRKALLRAYRFGLNRTGCAVVFQNPDDREIFARSGILEQGQTHLFQGAGVDLTQITPQPFPAGRTAVVLPSRMLRMKGIEEFCAAASILEARGVAVDMRLVGAPDTENPTGLSATDLDRLCRTHPVTWLGYQPGIAKVLAAAHIVALPSHGGEGLPKTLVDAAAAGRPAVASDVPGCREAVIDGETGLLCRPRNAPDLADKLQRIIEDPVLRERMGAAARKRAEDRFDVNDIAARHVAIYDDLARWNG